MSAPTAAALLEAIELSKDFPVGRKGPGGTLQKVHAVDKVSFQVWPGETLGLVGESGCGKSTLARCLVRLYDITSGTLRFQGQDITQLGTRQLRPARLHLQMVFQDPYSSLNPRRRVGDLIAEPLRVHGRRQSGEIDARVRALLGLVGLSPDHLNRFPHEFSGGQRQRIGIARALALSPKLIIADEPVSALDVSIQAQIINLFSDLQEQLGLTYIFIAHDLSVIRQVASRTAVMYLGSIVEIGPTQELYDAPAHPYTAALISAVPIASVDPRKRRERIVLAGDPPSPMDPPAGCRFHPRCSYASGRCRSERPALLEIGNGRSVACHHPLNRGRQASLPLAEPVQDDVPRGNSGPLCSAP
jgi:peptide/nickel transport system ATP-binding protein